MRRLATGVVLAATVTALVAVWSTQPAVSIRIATDGTAQLVSRLGRRAALPDTIRVARGGRPRVRIRNADARAHIVGIFRAPANATVEYSLPGPGRYNGLCTVHARRTLTIIVQ